MSVGGFVGFMEFHAETKAIGCVALGAAVNRVSGTNTNLGAFLGRNALTNADNYTANYSFDGIELPAITLTGLACNAITKAQARTALNWWNNTASTGYYAVVNTINPADVWTLADNKLPILSNEFFVNQSDALPAHLSDPSTVLESVMHNNKTLSIHIANNKLNILEDGVRSLQVIDFAGKVHIQQSVALNVIDISALSAGVYIVKAQTDSGYKTAKLQK
jgi:hypothetical protein